jgi:hypothetical protein
MKWTISFIALGPLSILASNHFTGINTSNSIGIFSFCEHCCVLYQITSRGNVFIHMQNAAASKSHIHAFGT